MSWYAQYDGVCEQCSGQIKKGQKIDWHDPEERTIQHTTCPEQPTACKSCYLVHAGDCF